MKRRTVRKPSEERLYLARRVCLHVDCGGVSTNPGDEGLFNPSPHLNVLISSTIMSTYQSNTTRFAETHLRLLAFLGYKVTNFGPRRPPARAASFARRPPT